MRIADFGSRICARLRACGRFGGAGPIILALMMVAAVALPLRAQVTEAAAEAASASPDAQTRIGTPATDAIARDAMLRLRSPVTPYHMLDMCPDAAAAALRDTLRMAAAAGMTADEMVDDVIARYGERMRAIPQRSGAGLWAWLAPPAVLVFGGLFVFWKLGKMRRPDAAPQESAAPLASALSAQERAELEAALREFEESTEEV
jgi:cytochrome c-type biogenesis protein CcmH